MDQHNDGFGPLMEYVNSKRNIEPSPLMGFALFDVLIGISANPSLPLRLPLACPSSASSSLRPAAEKWISWLQTARIAVEGGKSKQLQKAGDFPALWNVMLIHTSKSNCEYGCYR